MTTSDQGSLISSIVWLWGIGSVVALITSFMASKQIQQRGEAGNEMAIAGLIIGGIGAMLVAVLVHSLLLSIFFGG